MAIERLTIKDFLEQSQNKLVLDVRSPAEYNHAHIPGAISMPLFTDEERKVVGTTYKQQSREQAIKIGLDFFGPKMRRMVEEVESLLARQSSTTKDVFIYCWRGGMRSGGVAWLLDLYGFKVRVLVRGYKSFRKHVLQTFKEGYNLKILGGYTGSGKTEVLQQLGKNGEVVVDLEKIACHKGSAFGKTNSPQPTQEMFENILGVALIGAKNKGSSAAIWMEDESQRIGNLNIPNDLCTTMRNAPVYFIEVPFEERLQYIIKEYGCLDKEYLSSAIQRIRKRLGGLDTKNALQYLEEENVEACFSILLKYYDKHYLKGLYSRENLSAVLNKIACSTVTTANAQLLRESQVVI